MRSSCFLCLLVLMMAVALLQSDSGVVSAVQLSDPLPVTGASDAEYLEYLALCSGTDPRFVSAQVLANYKAAVAHLNGGGHLPKPCWVAPGEAGDLGWSFQEYTAVNVLQFCFKVDAQMRSSVSAEEAVNVMRAMVVEDGCEIMFPMSFEFIGASIELAFEFPEVMFSTPVPVEGVSGVVPNVRSFAINGYEITYLLGYLAQLMPGVSDNIGVVTSQRIVTEFQGAFAYWAGMQDAAAELSAESAQPVEPKKIYLWFINSFSDIDRALGATQDIVETYSANHISQTVDPYEPQVWLREAGLSGTGVIADMGLYAGDHTLASQVVRWDVAGLNAYALALVNGQGLAWGEATLPFLPCNAWIGAMSFGTLSPRVPAQVQEKVRAKYALLQSSPFASGFIFCGERTLPLLQPGQTLGPSGCMSFEQIFNISRVYPDIEDLGDYEIPLDVVEKPTSMLVVQSIMAAFGFVFALVTLIVLTTQRHTALVALNSYPVVVAILLSLAVAFVGLGLYVPNPRDGFCMASVFLYTLGMFSAMSFFVSKNLRYLLLWMHTRKMKRVELRVYVVLVPFVIFLTVAVGLLLAWMLADNPGAILQTHLDTTELGKYQVRQVCSSSDTGEVLLWVLAGYGLALLVVCLVVSYLLSRDTLHLWLSESRHTYMMCVIMIICVTMGMVFVALVDNNQSTLEWMVFVFGWVIAISPLICYYGVKMWVILFDPSSSALEPVSEYVRNNTKFGRARQRARLRSQHSSISSNSKASSSIEQTTPRTTRSMGSASNA
jgi:basic membrane lipoprotein Med (substrate-binding protein (PBP1-ABC) superfamily)